MSAPRSSLLRPDPTDHHASSRPESPSLLGDGDGFDFYGTPKPTFATFSPVTALSGGAATTSTAAKRSTILVHQKSPLLMATPPQITRALAYSHPFLLPLNKLAGLISWTTGDPWESFILVLVWWGVVLYGDTVMRYAGPVVLVLMLIAGMYGRRYSPLSSSGWVSEEGHTGSASRDSGGGGIGYFLFGIGASTSTPANSKASRDASGSKSKSHSKSQSVDATGANAAPSGKGANGHAASGANSHQRAVSEAVPITRRQKTLDEIVDTLREFTARCNILLEPLLDLTDFLSTQSTPTSATTRPALTALLIRILLCTPFWFALTLPPLRIVTTRRVAVVAGTVILTWHSRPMRVTRTILWRSSTVRRTAVLVTGLQFEGPLTPSKNVPATGSTATADVGNTPATAAAALQSKLSTAKQGRRLSTPRESELTKAIRRARAGHDAGVRFTFILYENQRRWVGLGWTTSLFTYERPAWTDEHNNEVPSKNEFELPEVEDGSRMRWRWVEGSRWHVEGVLDDAVRIEKTGPNGEHTDTWDYDGDGGRMGWVYYDNKWQNGRRGQDGWNRWTRRRKWFRDAELVEVDEDFTSNSDDRATTPTPTSSNPPSLQHRPGSPTPSHTGTTASAASTDGHFGAAERGVFDLDGDFDAASIASSKSTRGMQPPSLRRRATDASSRGVAAPAVTTTATATAVPASSMSQRRRDSAATAAEDNEAALSSSAGLKLHQARNEKWGVGDEVLMGLE